MEEVARQMSLRREAQAAVNRAVYERERSVREYVEGLDELLPAERAVLSRLGSSIAGKAVLDIGVGSGRTTATLLQLTDDYLGIDFSEAMVKASRRRFPGAQFVQCDARRMQHLGSGRYGFIWFSFNGIDSVNHEERQRVLSQVFDLLEPGGVFYFSSHNISSPKERPWQLRLYEWGWQPSKWLSSLDRMGRGIVNYVRCRSLHESREAYLIQTDSGHEFACPHYYTDPADQVRRLEQIGFTDVQTMGWKGQVFPQEHERIKKAGHVHYLARKPVARVV